MKFCTTMKQVMNKHKMLPKEFSEVTGMTHGTCKHVHQGRLSPVIDTFAPWVDYGISEGRNVDELIEGK